MIEPQIAQAHPVALFAFLHLCPGEARKIQKNFPAARLHSGRESGRRLRLFESPQFLRYAIGIQRIHTNNMK